MQTKLSHFFSGISCSESAALLLDYDGTLAPFHVEPAKAKPYPGIKELLETIQGNRRCRLAIVSGRKAEDVQRLLEIEGMEIWGCHGMERLGADGRVETATVDERTRRTLQVTWDELERVGLADRIERKPSGNAVHWRGLPTKEANEVRERVESVWAGLQDKAPLRLLHFKEGIELSAKTKNKGDVVRTIAAELREPAAMAYLGDDVTDEDAFLAIKGTGLGVLVADAYRETAAEVWIRPPGEVIGFLERWIGACGSAQR